MSIRLGAKVPNSGPHVGEHGIGAMARTLEEAGFESLWVSDHIVLPRTIDARYPFSADGRATWPTDTPYIDALIALALIAGATERASFGSAVLVLPLRHPVILAKQLASLDEQSGGRLRLGAGAGWLRDEFEALGVPFETRAGRFEEWVALLRDCWTGTPAALSGAHFTLPDGVLCLPTPAHRVPILVGGHSPRALHWAATLGDGWLGQQSLSELAPDEVTSALATIRAAAGEAGRDPGELQIVLRIVDSTGRSDEVAARLPQLERAGVDEVIVDVDWAAADPAAELERLAAAVS